MPTYGLNNGSGIRTPQATSPTIWDNPATQSARALGGALAQQGQGVAGTQQNTAQGFANQASGFNPQAQSVTSAGGMGAQPSPQPASGLGALQKQSSTPWLGSAGRSSTTLASPTFMGAQAAGLMSSSGKPPAVGGVSLPGSMQAPQPSGPAAFQTGTRATAQNLGTIGNVDPASLGGYGSVMGGLGGAPQVGDVGNIQTGSAPGQVAGTLGNMGMSSADQQSMMGRLNGFLDAPEGASVAAAQLEQAQANNVGQMLGMARSGRGGAGAQAQALAGAMSEGSAIASDTAGQMATLRAQEEDMRKNRALSAIGLGGDMATAARGQDLGFRGQDLSAAQGDQATGLGARGQDIQAAMADQSTQSQLEQLRAQTALGARGQDLQGLTADQGASIAARGQDLSALQGNQATALGARGQNVAQEGNVLNANTAMRGQDLSAVTGDADRNLAAQQLALQGKLGFGGLQNQATGQGLDYLSNANQQALGAEGLAQSMTQSERQYLLGLHQSNTAADASIRNANTMAQAQANSGPSFLQSLLPVAGTIGGAILGGPIGAGIGAGIGTAGARAIDKENPYG